MPSRGFPEPCMDGVYIYQEDWDLLLPPSTPTPPPEAGGGAIWKRTRHESTATPNRDSGHNSDDYDDDDDDAGTITPSYYKARTVSGSSSTTGTLSDDGLAELVHKCSRCRSDFVYDLNSNVPMSVLSTSSDPCVWHPGKRMPMRCGGADVVAGDGGNRQQPKKQRYESRYTCCQRSGLLDARNGCTVSRLHVWNGLRAGRRNGPLGGFVETKSFGLVPADDGDYGLLALDSEMVYTENGLELARISVVACNGGLRYERLVRPLLPVIDYNTPFSGITAELLMNNDGVAVVGGRSVPVVTLRDVQLDLLRIISSRTILVGHAIHNDLRMLKMVHRRVVDTSLLFELYPGDPFRPSLKALVLSYLQRDIQMAGAGHDSVCDARSALDLLRHFLMTGLRAS